MVSDGRWPAGPQILGLRKKTGCVVALEVDSWMRGQGARPGPGGLAAQNGRGAPSLMGAPPRRSSLRPQRFEALAAASRQHPASEGAGSARHFRGLELPQAAR